MLFQDVNGALVVHTPAKLNLFLEILGKRSDGYHELETLMVTVGWYDTLVVRPIGEVGDFSSGAGDQHSSAPRHPVSIASDIVATREDVFGPVRLSCRQAGSRSRQEDGAAEIPAGDDNLVVRAARLLQKEVGFRGGIAIDLTKRIPMAAGLAGGSSDAAATLWACNRAWGLGLSNAELMTLASRLGSDIAFFLADTPAAVCRGRGECVESVRFPSGMHFVIARPSGGLSTALVFRHCRPSAKPASIEPLLKSLQSGRLQDAGALLHNALQEPAELLSPEVAHLRFLFSKQPVSGHLMSGSGTAYFALCSHQRQAHHVAARIRAAGVRHVAVVQSRP